MELLSDDLLMTLCALYGALHIAYSCAVISLRLIARSFNAFQDAARNQREPNRV